MTAPAGRGEALDWVLAKLAAKLPKAPVYKPPELKPLKPAAPTATPLFPKKPELTEAEKVKRRASEHEVWERYVAATSPKEKNLHFQDLLKRQANIIAKHVGRFKGTEVNITAKKAAAIEKYRTALDTYDPNNRKGASLATWVNWNLRGLKRYVVGLQNTVRITEPTSQLVTPVRTATSELTERLGYAPTVKQISDFTHTKHWGGQKLSEKDILEVHAIRRSPDLERGGEEVEGAGVHTNDPYVQAAHVVYHQLKPHEQKVHELMFPRLPGKPAVLKSGAIANKLGWHVSKVSKAKNTILRLIQDHVGD